MFVYLIFFVSLILIFLFKAAKKFEQEALANRFELKVAAIQRPNW
jgi:hypothetical protein